MCALQPEVFVALLPNVPFMLGGDNKGKYSTAPQKERKKLKKLVGPPQENNRVKGVNFTRTKRNYVDR